MTLRDHPGMSYRGLKNWPPVWTQTQNGSVKTVLGEIGVLRCIYANDRIASKCYLVIDHEGQRYVGCLIFSDRSFANLVTRLLRTYVGRSIQEIGDLDVTHTL